MTESTAEMNREMDATRARMSRTLDQLDAKISETAQAVKRRVDVAQLVRDHPWPALGVAIGAGILLAATGTDEKVVAAGAAAATKIGSSSKDAIRKVTNAVRQRGNDEQSTDPSDDATAPSESRPGFGARLFEALAAPLMPSLERMLDDMRTASRDVGESLRGRGVPREDATARSAD